MEPLLRHLLLIQRYYMAEFILRYMMLMYNETIETKCLYN